VQSSRSDDADDKPSDGTTNLVAVATNRVKTLGELHTRLLELLKGKPTRQRMDAVFELGKTLGAEDFEHALALDREVPVEWMRSVFCSGLFFSRGRERGRQALEELEAAKESGSGAPYGLRGFDGAFAAGGAMVGWASVEPRGAVAFQKDDQSSDEMLRALAYAAWGLEDLDAALTHANALPPGVNNFMDWAKSDPERAVEFALTLDENLRPAVLERIAQGWASNWSETYRADFMSYLSIVIDGGSNDFISKSVNSWWAQYEPQAAVEYAASLDEKNARDEQLRKAFSLWVEADPRQSMEWWNAYSPQHNDSQTLASQMIAELSESNPEAAARMLEAMPSLAENADFRETVLSKWMEWDARAAFDWITGKHVDHDAMLAASRSAGVSMARWNLADAMDWARKLPDTSLQPDALSGVALVQGYAEPEKSTDWIRDLPPGPTRDRSLLGYVSGVLEHAKGSVTVNSSQLDNVPDSLPQLADTVQKSALDEKTKQRLLALIYGWSQ
jgi:hypothetical protein